MSKISEVLGKLGVEVNSTLTESMLKCSECDESIPDANKLGMKVKCPKCGYGLDNPYGMALDTSTGIPGT